MFENYTKRRVGTFLALAGGSLALAACGNTVEGIGNLPMVHCGKNDTLRANTASLGALPAGQRVELGKNITTNHNGNNAKGDFAVISEGEGNFSVIIENTDGNVTVGPTNVAKLEDASGKITVLQSGDGHNVITIADQGEVFEISGSEGPQHSTSLDFMVECSTPAGQ